MFAIATSCPATWSKLDWALAPGTVALDFHVSHFLRLLSSGGMRLKNCAVMVGSKRDFRFRRQKHIYAGMKNRGFAITIEPHTK